MSQNRQQVQAHLLEHGTTLFGVEAVCTKDGWTVRNPHSQGAVWVRVGVQTVTLAHGASTNVLPAGAEVYRVFDNGDEKLVGVVPEPGNRDLEDDVTPDPRPTQS